MLPMSPEVPKPLTMLTLHIMILDTIAFNTNHSSLQHFQCRRGRRGPFQ